MRMIFLGTRNFHFFSPALIRSFDKIVVASASQPVPADIAATATVIRVNDAYNPESKTNELVFEETVRALKAQLGDDRNARLFCNQEANLMLAEEVRVALGLESHLTCDVERFRSKPLMKNLVANAGLRTPRYLQLSKTHPESFESLCLELGKRLIAKPCASVGSRGVFKLFNANDYSRFLQATADDDCLYEAEEFIEGTLYHCDMIFQGGALKYSVLSRYSCPNADLQEGRTLGSIIERRDSPLYSRAIEFSTRCMRALGSPDGCFHMELFESPAGEIIFLEVAARSPGLDIVPAYRDWLGVNFYDAELLIQAGRDVSRAVLPHADHVPQPGFYAVFPRATGLITSLNSPAIAGRYRIDWKVKSGEQVSKTTTNLDFAGMIRVHSTDEESAYREFEYITTRFVPISYATLSECAT
jgi:biotin carboxylase